MTTVVNMTWKFEKELTNVMGKTDFFIGKIYLQIKKLPFGSRQHFKLKKHSQAN